MVRLLPLSVIHIREGLTGFEVGDPPDASTRAFTVALANGALDFVDSRKAFACDVLAVEAGASLALVDLPMLRRRAGGALGQAVEGERISAAALLASGLALFTIEAGAAAPLDRILGLADTLWALARARRFAVPNWSVVDEGVAIDIDGRLATIRLRNAALPCFSIALLEAIDAFLARWRAGEVAADTLLFTSATPATFSMGGDLATIAALARARDETMLRHYAHLSVRVVHALWTGLGRDVLTIGAVDGKAFGSGFEAILACQIAVAGADATFAFPEARFGLFPGMGATSLLGRRASPSLAEALILSGRKLEAAHALEMHAIDDVAGPEGAEAYAKQALVPATASAEARRRSALARRRGQSYAIEEAIAVVDVWVEAVLGLSEGRLDEIDRIARMQTRRSANKKESIQR